MNMKLIQGALILLLSGCAMGQDSAMKAAPSAHPTMASMTGQASATAPKNNDKARAAITADTAVITVPNVCAATAKDCKTEVTRKQFESTLLGLSGGKAVSPEIPRRFASQYGEVLVFSEKAIEGGMDKEADTEAGIRYARMQVLATRYLETLKEKAQPTDEQIKKYYESNPEQYQGAELDRLVLPSSHGKSKKAEELKALAEEMRKRLAAGEDAAKLEDEIYAKLELKNPPSTTAMIAAQGDPEQDFLRKLKKGEVSEVVTNQMALVVFRSKGPKLLPLETVKDEIHDQLFQQNLKAAVDKVMGDRKSVLNDAYFGPATPTNPHEQ
jgi:hypothetical protein